jgi:hypothetical protein
MVSALLSAHLKMIAFNREVYVAVLEVARYYPIRYHYQMTRREPFNCTQGK